MRFRPRRLRSLLRLTAIVIVALGGVRVVQRHIEAGREARSSDQSATSLGQGRDAGSGDAPSDAEHTGDDHSDDDRAFVFQMPSGKPTMLTCAQARAIIGQVRAGLAYAPDAVAADAFAASVADWMDPHGLLSMAPDAPTSDALRGAAARIVPELEGSQAGCGSMLQPASVVAEWARTLSEDFERGRNAPSVHSALIAATTDLALSDPARDFAFDLGRRITAFATAYGDIGKRIADDASRRFFPPLDNAGWSDVLLAAAVRAYVPLVDPHGEWAPFDEESSIYEMALASQAPERLWGRAAPTAVGFRITESASAPLLSDDVVLQVGNLTTVGLPIEQFDQLAYATAEMVQPARIVVLRKGALAELKLPARAVTVESGSTGPQLPVERITFGDADAIVVSIKEVRDSLGEDLQATLAAEQARSGRKIAGLVLDLRGNGGGSTDGAISALSLFLPSAPVVAMRRRDGTVEVDRAPAPPDTEQWHEPVATLVDGATASAAEIIAGALAAYRRGPTVGTRTFGKGCAQEYVDDDAHTGVLRLTTLIYALPDGTAVQRVGLTPQLRVPFAPLAGSPAGGRESTPAPSMSRTNASANTSSDRESEAPRENRESDLLHTAPTWEGPDLRPYAVSKWADAPWPSHGGAVGPCQDPGVCRALRLLGANRDPRRPTTARRDP